MRCGFTLFFICFIALSFSYTQTEKGLEGIIVEKYYISNASDAANTSAGTLPVGSTTYRIYVDMKPGYKFLAAYGDANHELNISSTTKFFNNEDRGDVHPVFNKNALKSNTVMVDSWLSAGSACLANLGVLKSKDDGVANVVNADGILANNDANAGIPLTEQDGIKVGKIFPAQSAGFNADLEILNNSNDFPNGVSLKSNSGAWFTPEGSVGADSLDNMVLIAQLTTDGNLTFELNIQLKTPIPGITQSFVAKDPKGEEIFEPTLTFDSEKVDTKDVPQIYSFVVYPNPTTDKIFFKSGLIGNNAQFSISDLNGTTVLKGSMDSDSQQMDVSSLNAGVYVLTINNDGKLLYSKIVKI